MDSDGPKVKLLIELCGTEKRRRRGRVTPKSAVMFFQMAMMRERSPMKSR